MPPAFDTAATSLGPEIAAMPARKMGYLTPQSRVTRFPANSDLTSLMTSKLHVFSEHPLHGIVSQDDMILERTEDMQSQSDKKGCPADVEQEIDHSLDAGAGLDKCGYRESAGERHDFTASRSGKPDGERQQHHRERQSDRHGPADDDLD